MKHPKTMKLTMIANRTFDKSIRNTFMVFPSNVIFGSILFYRISPPFETDNFRLVIIVNLGLLLCLCLLLCCFLLLLLLSLSGASSNCTNSCTNGCPFTRVSGDGSDSRPKKRTSDDRTSGNRAITEEMSANPRLSGQVDPMSDD
jgi:hypothetical protein